MAEERVQRRVSAILAAGMVGYLRLIEAEETGSIPGPLLLRAVELIE